MVRLRKRMVNNKTRARTLTCKPSFHALRIFNEDLVAIHMLTQRRYLNRPIYVGFSILNISKTLMYDFHNTSIKRNYDSKPKLLFTVTDSLAYLIHTKDVYEDMLYDAHHFDTSEYEKDHPLYSTANKKVLGKMKDETRRCAIHEFGGLKSKMYSLMYEKQRKKEGDNGTDGQEEKKTIRVEKKTAKRIKKNVIKHHTRHEHYKTCLFNRETHMSHMTQIRSYGH